MHKQVVGHMGRVVLAQFDKGEDLMTGIVRVIKDQNMRTGYIASITGALQEAKVQRYLGSALDQHTETIHLEGPLEVSGHGVFGIVEAPEQGTTPFWTSGYVHGEPYVHVHLVTTSANETICGHLMTGGSTVKSSHPVSHFTIFIVEVVGAELQIRCDEKMDKRVYHFITELP